MEGEESRGGGEENRGARKTRVRGKKGGQLQPGSSNQDTGPSTPLHPDMHALTRHPLIISGCSPL